METALCAICVRLSATPCGVSSGLRVCDQRLMADVQPSDIWAVSSEAVLGQIVVELGCYGQLLLISSNCFHEDWT